MPKHIIHVYTLYILLACNGKIQLTIYCTCLGNKMIHKDYAQVRYIFSFQNDTLLKPNVNIVRSELHNDN